MESYRSFTVILYDRNPLHLQKVWGSADCIMMKVSRIYCSEYLQQLSRVDEFNKPCLYLLVDEKKKAYIGQAKSFARRVRDHLFKKDWWTKAYVFVSDSGRYHTASVEYLEYHAILAAQKTERYDTSENKQTPGTPTLPPHEHSQMNEAFREIKYFLKYERCLLLDPLEKASLPSLTTQDVSPSPSSAESPTMNEYMCVENQPVIFFVKGKGRVAQGCYLNDGTQRFIVLKGAEISPTHTNSFGAHKARTRLIERCSTTKEGELILEENYIFSSASTASACCLGRNSNGWEDWKDAKGKTLKQYIEETNN